MDPSPSVRPATDGVAIDVEVVPGASDSRFPSGYNTWRKRVEARVRAPPEDGRANAELTALVAAFFEVAPGRVRVASGHTSRRKTLTVTGLVPGEALARLREGLR